MPTSANLPRAHLAIIAIVLAVLCAYANTLKNTFVYDDAPSIVENASIHSFSPITHVLFPTAGGLAGSGRPVVNLSYALNYALAGESGTQSAALSARGFHTTNLLIHLLATLTLFGVMRHTLRRAAVRRADTFATLITLLWALHPLQTESVAYLSQRSEALVSLFFLLTLYCFIRERLALSVLCCAVGMATKEVMVAAPLIVLLYDRTFVAGSFRAALAARRGYYLALAATWLLLAALVASTHGRGGTAGLHAGVSSLQYALTQCVAIPHYLRLSLWPTPLIIDYGRVLGGSPAAVAAGAFLLLLLAAATVFALIRRPALGFCGVWFFALLAPSSSIIPVTTETMAEHRMYLPLAAVITLAVLALAAAASKASDASATRAFGPVGQDGSSSTVQPHPMARVAERSERFGPKLGVEPARWGQRAPPVRHIVVVTLCILATLALGAATIRRNADYRDNFTLYTATVAALPTNPYAHNNLGVELTRRGQIPAAIEHYQRALALRPEYPEALNDLGGALVESGHSAEAIPYLQSAVRLHLHYAEAENNLGMALVYAGRPSESVAYFNDALRDRPAYPEAENNLSTALNQLSRSAEAIPHAQAALRLRPDYPEAHNSLGNAYALTGDRTAAIAEYREALRLRPDLKAAQLNLNALLNQP